MLPNVLYIYNFTSKLIIFIYYFFLLSGSIALNLFWVFRALASTESIFASYKKPFRIFNSPILIIFIWILTVFIWSNNVLFYPVLNFMFIKLADCIEIIWEGRLHLIFCAYYRLSFESLKIRWFNVQIVVRVNAISCNLRKPFL